MSPDIILASGLLMGLASSLHCAGLCGGIASSLLMATSPRSSAASRVPALLSMQIGRALSYVLGGALVGSAGEAFGSLLQFSGSQEILRLLSALILVWVGMSIAGLVPGVQRLDGRLASLLSAVPLQLPRSVRVSSPLLAGMAWGLAPCGMVYNALLTAMLTGSAGGGAAFMAGFGLATIPAVAVVAFGTVALHVSGRPLANRSRLRQAIGALLCLMGLASAAMPGVSLVGLCIG